MTPAERGGFLAHSLTARYARSVARAGEIIAEALDELPPAYVATSWGKDSIVLTHLVQRADPYVPVVHVGNRHQGLLSNYSAVRTTYLARWPIVEYRHIEVEIGGASIRSVINTSGLNDIYPTRYLGLRMQENGARVYALRKYGAIHQYTSGEQAGLWRVCPLIGWSWQDVWAYIAVNELPHLAVYDHPALGPKSVSRTSSVYSARIFTEEPSARGGVTLGRIAAIRQYAPAFWDLLVQHSPRLEQMI